MSKQRIRLQIQTMSDEPCITSQTIKKNKNWKRNALKFVNDYWNNPCTSRNDYKLVRITDWIAVDIWQAIDDVINEQMFTCVKEARQWLVNILLSTK